MLLCAWTFYVNRLDLRIFDGCYTYLQKIHIYRNIQLYVCYYIHVPAFLPMFKLQAQITMHKILKSSMDFMYLSVISGV